MSSILYLYLSLLLTLHILTNFISKIIHVLERKRINNKEYVVGFHTQEFRNKIISEPILCDIENAWLGSGYYFWVDLEFAKFWGEDFKKRRTGYYSIYCAYIDIDNCINAVFDEEQYFFFRRCIEKSIEHFKLHGFEITLKRVHQFLSDNFWNKMNVSGIIYDDLPFNPFKKPNRKYSEVEFVENGKMRFFYYKKRIQLVVFNLENISTFAPYLEKQS